MSRFESVATAGGGLVFLAILWMAIRSIPDEHSEPTKARWVELRLEHEADPPGDALRQDEKLSDPVLVDRAIRRECQRLTAWNSTRPAGVATARRLLSLQDRLERILETGDRRKVLADLSREADGDKSSKFDTWAYVAVFVPENGGAEIFRGFDASWRSSNLAVRRRKILALEAKRDPIFFAEAWTLATACLYHGSSEGLFWRRRRGLIAEMWQESEALAYWMEGAAAALQYGALEAALPILQRVQRQFAARGLAVQPEDGRAAGPAALRTLISLVELENGRVPNRQEVERLVQWPRTVEPAITRLLDGIFLDGIFMRLIDALARLGLIREAIELCSNVVTDYRGPVFLESFRAKLAQLQWQAGDRAKADELAQRAARELSWRRKVEFPKHEAVVMAPYDWRGYDFLIEKQRQNMASSVIAQPPQLSAPQDALRVAERLLWDWRVRSPRYLSTISDVLLSQGRVEEAQLVCQMAHTALRPYRAAVTAGYCRSSVQ